MAFYPPPGSQPHSVYSSVPSVTAYPTSPYYQASRRSRRHSTSSPSSYPLPANYGLNSYPHWYGQGYSGVPAITSASPNGQMYTVPQHPQHVPQTQLPVFGNTYIPPSSTVIQAPGRIIGPDTAHYSHQGYYPMQGGQVGQPQTIVVKMDGGGRHHRRHHYRRRPSSY